MTPFSGWCTNKGADSTWTVGSGAYRRWDKVSLSHSQPAGMSGDLITGPRFGDGLASIIPRSCTVLFLHGPGTRLEMGAVVARWGLCVTASWYSHS